ncbi:hypothetical protein RPALISO_47 [Ruegeria phage RpAliso]|nr:hypothetical protein RPALISO_47 [Ruegeria phage RpAliso]
MKIINGTNPDYADYDELDDDAGDAREDFDMGRITYEELRHLIGPEAAKSHIELHHSDEDSIDDLFDDPYDL